MRAGTMARSPIRGLCFNSLIVRVSSSCGWRALRHDIHTAVDVERLPGQTAGVRSREIGAGVADIHRINELAQRGALRRFVEQQLEILEPRSGTRLQRPRRDGMHPNALAAKFIGEI